MTAPLLRRSPAPGWSEALHRRRAADELTNLPVDEGPVPASFSAAEPRVPAVRRR